MALIKDVPPPTTADIELCKIAASQCRTPDEFCNFMEVDLYIFNHWVETNVYFRGAFKSWKNYADRTIEAALAKRAIGFTKKIKKDILTRAGTIETLVTEEYFPPDTAAANFWLKNRQPEEWKDTKQIDLNVQADIRAWLVNAMSDTDRDETEILDLLPADYSSHDSVGIQATPALEASLELPMPIIENDLEIVLENEPSHTSETTIDPEPNLLSDPLGSLNSRWG